MKYMSSDESDPEEMGTLNTMRKSWRSAKADAALRQHERFLREHRIRTRREAPRETKRDHSHHRSTDYIDPAVDSQLVEYLYRYDPQALTFKREEVERIMKSKNPNWKPPAGTVTGLEVKKETAELEVK